MSPYTPKGLTLRPGDTLSYIGVLRLGTAAQNITGWQVSAWLLPTTGAEIPLTAEVLDATAGRIRVRGEPALTQGLVVGTYRLIVRLTASPQNIVTSNGLPVQVIR